MIWSFYLEDGTLTGSKYIGPESLISINTPKNCKAVEGSYDYLSQKVDITTGEVIDYQPPQPSADHEWSSTTKRWTLKSEIAAAQQLSKTSQHQIDALERKQLRCMRELAIDATSPDAKKQLQDIDTQIGKLRLNLIKSSITST